MSEGARSNASGPFAAGLSLVELDDLCGQDKALRRLARHLWVRRQLDSGETLYGLAERTGLPRRALEHWAAALELCACGLPRSPASGRCDRCARRARVRWTPQQLLSERDRYRQLHERMPRSSDWNATRNPTTAHAWPPASSVGRRFGSWAAFLRTP